jgi:hypothetical protein
MLCRAVAILPFVWIAGAQPAPDFAKDVAPILQRRCLACHNAATRSSGLRLDQREGLLAGGYSGKVIQPGSSASSRLIRLVEGSEKIVMPPVGPRLKPGEVDTLRNWIDAGAKWPSGFAFRSPQPARSTHWAFVAPDTSQAQSTIDHFILGRLNKLGISPSPPAERHTLVRRVSLDLTGLPPSPADVDKFENDARPEAYRELVDRLLDSPHFGERWARPWLDLARYADSDGYETDQLRPHAWRWRQWVIDALNRNLPYDQFTIQQIAGDLLPAATLDQKIATGFHRNTLSNREGGADLEEYRVEQIVDRVSTVGSTWLGLTVGCARCHDHKYDPISQKEFFELYAIFNSADEVNIAAPADGEWGEYLREWPAYLKKRSGLLEALESDLAPELAEWERRVLDAEQSPGRDHQWDRQLELLGLIWEGNKGGGQLEGVYILKTPAEQRTQAQRRRLFDYFLRRGSLVNPEKFKSLAVTEIVKKLDELDKAAPALTMAPVLFENSIRKPNYLHVRGDFRSRGIDVAPGIPSLLPAPQSGTIDRLSVARWLVSRDNPLTARVAVNRIWQELFGTGLVRTSEDFGKQGSRPTHPELLDWLAVRFMDSGWDIKKTIRLIVMSDTYRQSSKDRPEVREKDPQNEFLARQSRLRLPAEIIRDQGLAISGLLSPTVGGPSVHPPQPAAVAMEAFETPWVASRGADRYRRGIYTWIQRTAPFAQFITFDAPDPTRACSRRERSNTPLQALTLLNDPVFIEMAQAFTDRLFREHADMPPEERISLAYRSALGRQAKPAEVKRLLQYLEAQRAMFVKEGGSATSFFNWSVANLSREESAAWAGLASILFNLDEFLTRE